jgi:hypothetical protein
VARTGGDRNSRARVRTRAVIPALLGMASLISAAL